MNTIMNLLIPTQRREDFLKILPRYSVGAELGVFKGEFSEQILKSKGPGISYDRCVVAYLW